jgi:predicted MFS family arabinose efflux permease
VALMIGTISTLTLAAEYCPSRAEGFAFAGLMSIMNLADVFSTNVGAILYDKVFDSHMAPLIVVSAVSTAVCVVLVPLLRLPR